jgi:hypothetical protein
MKWYWCEIMQKQKEDRACNISYATLPKLLNKLMQKDFSNTISSGFEATKISL